MTTTDRERKKTQRDTLALEAALVLLLLGAVKKRNAKAALASVLLASSLRAKTLAANRVDAELQFTTNEKLLAAAVLFIRQPSARYRQQTARLANSVVTDARKRIDLAKQAPDPRAAKRAAEAALETRLRTIATTETARIVEEERARVAHRIAREDGRPMWKTWDATLDLRTCPQCAHLNGVRVPLRVDFSSGNPPLHPRCRCSVVYEFAI